MGTNFYWDPPDEVPNDDDPQYHIGKRSAAGMYCYDCNISMCAKGEAYVHRGSWEDGDDHWHKRCPECGLSAQPEDLKDSCVGVELGFGEAKQRRPDGMHSCCSFSFTQNQRAVRERCMAAGDNIEVFDEYNRPLTGYEFLAMVEVICPIVFDCEGEWFT
jgi:hypothetical protein